MEEVNVDEMEFELPADNELPQQFAKQMSIVDLERFKKYKLSLKPNFITNPSEQQCFTLPTLMLERQ